MGAVRLVSTIWTVPTLNRRGVADGELLGRGCPVREPSGAGPGDEGAIKAGLAVIE
jgi:hypothetical protein